MPSDDTLKLLACQIDIPDTTTAAARDTHLAETAEKLRGHLQAKTADLVVFPELSSIGYSRAAFDCLDELSEPLDGISFQTWSAVAKDFGVHICYGFARKAASGRFVSMAVVSPDGTLAGYYDKLHMCHYGASMEKDYFKSGGHLFTFRIKGFTLSPIICYDIRIPELSRVLTLKHGVDVILHCGAYYRDESFSTWHDFTTTRAMENQVFFLSLNRAGNTWGNSAFCWPWMDEATPATRFCETAEDFRSFRLKKATLHQARENYTFLKDRLPDYDSLRAIHSGKTAERE